ncbi:MAG: ABC transporter permease [Anaerolineales bacterium]|nr:ABC transporter permease [Anaerolineales bacterium]
MLAPRWRKVLKDLWSNKSRTVLTILTIAVGVFAVGYVSISFDMLLNDMDVDFQAANPHAALIYTDLFDDDLLHSLSQVPGVADVEGRSTVGATLPGELLPVPKQDDISITFNALQPLSQMHIDIIETEDPDYFPPLGKGDVYIEKSLLSAVPLKVGDTLEAMLYDGRMRTLQVVAIVHSVGDYPYMIMNSATAFVSPETLEWLGGSVEYSQLLLTVAENKTDEEHVREVAAAVADKLEKTGRQAYFTLILSPGHHYGYQITSTLGVMLYFLGALSVLLSAFLVINTINALLTQHIRQIGVMKAVGAHTSQLVAMYLVLVMCFGLIAFIIALPLAMNISYGTLQFIANYLNFDPGPIRVTPTALILMLLVAFGLPLLAALVPVINGTRITVREAFSSYGLGRNVFGSSWFDRMLEAVRGLPRPLLISLRNTFRRKARLFLTLSTLILAGAIFIGVYNLRAAMDSEIEKALGYILSDVNISFNQPMRIERVIPLALSVPGVVHVEPWSGATGGLLTADRTTSTEISLLAPPSDSSLLKSTMASGRWLQEGDENALVIGNTILPQRPDLKVGEKVYIDIDGRETEWIIIGIYSTAGNSIPPLVYADYDYVSRLLGQVDQTGMLRIQTAKHDMDSQRQVGEQLEQLYKDSGIQVGTVMLGAQLVAANKSTTDMLVYVLLSMSTLIGVVGGLGLASTMSLNVMERTRETGVMRAVGASNGAIQRIVLVEGLLIGIISWSIGALLAIPIGQGLCYVVGVSFLQAPLDFVFSMDGFLLWLAIVGILSVLACLAPARFASRMTVRETLAYE